MSSAHVFPPSRQGTAFRQKPLSFPVPGLLLALIGWLCLAAAPAGLFAAQFVTPKGLNIEAQESLLTERVKRMANELIGDKLVDVVVHIGYLRTDEKIEASRIKLPGFNHYIRPGEGQGDIISAHTRLRQVVVMVEESIKSEPEAIEQEIRLMGKFDPEQGDLVRVITVSAQEKAERKNGKTLAAMEKEGKPEEEKIKGEEEKTDEDLLAKDALKQFNDDLSKRMAAERTRQALEAREAQLGMMMAKASLEEAQSTLTLMKARQSFFRGNLDKSLNQILQSIAENPNNPQAYAMLGSLYYAVDWKHLAVKYWEKSLTLDPDNTDLEDLMNQVKFKAE